jgi:DNA-directed RNA polymerase subunit RPC12/RpoP
MMITIECPKCGTKGSQSLLKPDYVGPYRCWKCRELFTITIVNNEVKGWETLTEEQLAQQEEQRRQIDALKAKFGKKPED